MYTKCNKQPEATYLRFSNKHYLIECPDTCSFGNRIPKRSRPLGKSCVIAFPENFNVLSFSIVGQLALCFHSNKETRRSQNTYLDIIIYQSWKSLCSKTAENIWIEGAEKPLWLLLLDPLCCSVAVSTCTSLGWLDCSDEGKKKIKNIQKTLDGIIHAL